MIQLKNAGKFGKFKKHIKNRSEFDNHSQESVDGEKKYLKY